MTEDVTTKTVQVARGAALFRAFRAKVGLSQIQAGEQLGLSGPSISAWESGDKRPKTHIRQRIETWSSGEVPMDSWLLDEERVPAAPCVPKTSPEAA